MRVQGDNGIIDELLGRDGGIVFNLVAFIRGQDNAMLYTDGASYLTAQSSPNTPMWIYVNPRADERTESELFEVLDSALNQNKTVRINAQEIAEKTLSRFVEVRGLELVKGGILNAYSAVNVKKVRPAGELILSEKNDKDEIKELVRIAAKDDKDDELTDEQATEFAQKHAGSDGLFLWRDKEIVSMARIVRYGNYGRITSVVTKRKARGRGYAKMLVGTLAEKLIAEGLFPVLYARAENPSSNACYRHLGFEKKGEICEFTIKIKE